MVGRVIPVLQRGGATDKVTERWSESNKKKPSLPSVCHTSLDRRTDS